MKMSEGERGRRTERAVVSRSLAVRAATLVGDATDAADVVGL
jgi:hypothetical protein